MTTDANPLQESIARRLMEALDPHSEIIAVHEGYGAEVVTHAHQSAVVAAVLPIIAAEVRSAQHEAWDEGLEAGRDRWADSREFGDPPVNPYRAATIEQED